MPQHSTEFRTVCFFAVLVTASICCVGQSVIPVSNTTGTTGLTGFVANPGSNTADFNSYIDSRRGRVVRVDFSTQAPGPFKRDAYADIGLTLVGNNGLSTVSNGSGPGQGGDVQPKSAGEGPHPPSNYLGDSAGDDKAATLTISFSYPVMAAGVSTIDLDSASSPGNAVIQAFSGPDGTGQMLGTFSSATFNFQQNNLYFMGTAGADAAIRSLIFTSYGHANDRVGIADIQFARVPDHFSWAWVSGLVALIVGGLYLTFRLRNRAATPKIMNESAD